MKVKTRVATWRLGRKAWHKGEWSKKKRELRKELRRLMRGRIGREEYVKKRKEYRKCCEEKKKEEKEKIIRKVEEGKVWELVNRERKKINKMIELEVWKKYFMGLLGELKKRAIKGMEREEGRGEKDEKELELEKVKVAI